jgi:hypothetical protein
MSTAGAPGLATPEAPPRRRRPVDDRVRHLLRIPDGRPAARYDDAHRLFGTSMVLSGTRCLLSYLVFPLLAPIVGVAAGVGIGIGIPIGVLALYFDVLGIRRFWLADHRWKWPVTFVYLAVMLMVTALVVYDVVRVS